MSQAETILNTVFDNFEIKSETPDLTCPDCQALNPNTKFCCHHLEKREKIRELKRQWDKDNEILRSEKERKRRELEKEGKDKQQIKEELFEKGYLKREPKIERAEKEIPHNLSQKYEFGANLGEKERGDLELVIEKLRAENQQLKNELVAKDKKIEKLETENEKLDDERHTYKIKYETLWRSLEDSKWHLSNPLAVSNADAELKELEKKNELGKPKEQWN